MSLVLNWNVNDAVMCGIPKTQTTFLRYAQILSANHHIGIANEYERKKRSLPVEKRGREY